MAALLLVWTPAKAADTASPGLIAGAAAASVDVAQGAISEAEDRRALIAGDETDTGEEAPGEDMLRRLIETSELDADERDELLADLDAAEGPIDRFRVEARLRAALLD